MTRNIRHISAFGTLISIAFVSALIGCASADTDGSEFNYDHQELRLNGVLTLSDLISYGDDYYVLDSKERKVFILGPDGNVRDSLGGPGEGPGEFRTPKNLAIKDSTIAVSERSGRVSLFSLDGQFRHSFVAIGVIHLNSDFRFVNDNTVMIGGLREESGDNYGGSLLSQRLRFTSL